MTWNSGPSVSIDRTPLVNMTDEDIDELDTDALRELVTQEELEDEFHTREVVFEITLNERVFAHSGTLTKVDELLTKLRTGTYYTVPYKITYNYDRVSMTTWSSNTRLKTYLKAQRARLFREEADEIANRGNNGWAGSG